LQGIKTAQDFTGINLTGNPADDNSPISGSSLPKLSNDYMKTDVKLSGVDGGKNVFDKLLDVWDNTKADTKTTIIASMISGMFGAKSKQQLADAATKNAESAALNAKTNADIAANTIGLRNNAAAGMTGAGIMTSPVKPKFVDVPAQRIRPGA